VNDQPKDRRGVDEAVGADHEAVSGTVPGRDGGPQDEQDMAAAEGLTASKKTGKAYEEMLERGARQKGEGRTP